MPIQIVTDSGADLPSTPVSDLDIEMVPLKVSFGLEEYQDRVNLSIEEFWHRLASSLTLPRTSQPSPQQFVEVFRRGLAKGYSILCICLSSGLSGTYHSASLAHKILGSPKNLKLIDSLNASIGQGLLVLQAAQLAREGLQLERLTEVITSYRNRLQTILTLDTLENVVRGGRLNRIQGIMGSILDIKLILSKTSEGKLEPLEKVRGRKKALSRMLELIPELGGNLQEKVIGISHLDCLPEAIDFKNQLIDRYSPREVIVSPMGCTIGTYAGQGGMIVSF
ncbi:MAG: DegV family protein [Syntrophomonadaceae bacterium]|nr:DegV family protein [Syntrophomonadaceae bacterium]